MQNDHKDKVYLDKVIQDGVFWTPRCQSLDVILNYKGCIIIKHNYRGMQDNYKQMQK